jgi:hypothetical protein
MGMFVDALGAPDNRLCFVTLVLFGRSFVLVPPFSTP